MARSERKSNHLPACPCKTAGREWSKTFHEILIFKFIVACMAAERGSPRILRAPSALGPNSIRPWNQPTTFPSASKVATDSIRSDSSSNRCPVMPWPDKNAAICSGVKLGPRKLPCCASRLSICRGFVEQLVPDKTRLLPRGAPPHNHQQPAGSKDRQNHLSLSRRPLATQLSRNSASQDQML